MAERRMFAKTIVLSDAFLDMPLSARCLYFTLGMLADDDGFVNSPKSIMRQCGASLDDLNILMAKKFILAFESGVIVIKHWRINNYLRNDRYRETKYLDERGQLDITENGAYALTVSDGIPSTRYTEDRIGKDRIGKDSNIYTRHEYGEYKHVLLTDEQYGKLVKEYGTDMTAECIKYLDEYIQSKGYKCKDYYLTIKRWVVSAVTERQTKEARNTENLQTPTYTDDSNPEIDEERLKELMERRNGKDTKNGSNSQVIG